MKVNFNGQAICVTADKFRGIPYFVKELIVALGIRNNCDLTVSFYDYKKERNNRLYIEKYLSEVICKIQLYECANKYWRKDMEFWENDNHGKAMKYDYESDIEIDADVHYFPHSFDG